MRTSEQEKDQTIVRTPSTKVSRLAVAIAAVLALHATGTSAQISVSGATSTYPGFFVIGPGNTDIGNNLLTVGATGTGSMTMAGGQVLSVGAISVGDGGPGVGSGIVAMTGTGTKLILTGDGFSPGVLNRFQVGNWGTGTFVLSGGATIDGRANANACLGANHYCSTFIGNASGSTGTFTLTGAGTSASFLRFFNVGNAAVFHPPIDTFTFGTPGDTTQGRVEVLDGALLRTQGTAFTSPPSGGSPSGTERSFADVVIRGAGSTWLLEPRTLDNLPAILTTGNGPNSWATVTISEGGKMRMEGASGAVYNNINLTNGYGRTDFTVTGAGSRLEMTGSNGVLNVGMSLGTANFQVLNGAVVDGALITQVGRDGAHAVLNIDGAGSRMNIYGIGVAGTTNAGNGGGMLIGRNGNGVATVSSGGRLDVAATGATNVNPYVILGGTTAGSAGTLNITGANSVVSITAASVLAGGGAGESFNPYFSAGYDGSGTLNISAGGKLLMDGGAFSTVAASRATELIIGGRSDGTPGGKGIANVTGAGSEIRLTGTDTIAVVGKGPSSVGQFNLSAAASLTSTIFTVGRSGGVGVAKVDGATVNLAGQFTGSSQSGAALVVGDGNGSTGVLTLTNGASVTISNPAGTNGTGVSIGGSGVRNGGDGTLNLSGGSSITINGPAGNTGFSVGRTGTGLARVTGSTIDVGGGSLYVGRFSGSDGVMIVSGGSTVNAGYVGVGRNQTGDGGTGTLIVNASTLTGQNIEIGPNGYLGGNGTIVGNIVNYGVVSPGNSPGTLVVDGSFVNAAGGRLLMEIESDGHGGFNTDHLIFRNGSTINLAGVDVRFRFLGSTDPDAFKASGLFNINQFFQGQDALGQNVNLPTATFDGATFSAQADTYHFSSFSFSPAGGASFALAPVPEPSEWVLLLAGLGLMVTVASRKRRAHTMV